MSAEFDQLVAEFERFQAGIRNVDDRLAGLGAMQEELAGLQASASSPDGGVTVVAGPGGAVLDVRFTDAALARGAQALSATLMATLREAIGAAARRQATIVQEHVGEDVNVVDQVVEAQAELYGKSVEEMRETLAQETAPPAPQRAEEDFAEERVLRQADAPPAPPQTPQTPRTPPPSPGGGSAGDAFLKKLFDDEE